MTDKTWPMIDDAIWALRPDYAALSIIARGACNGPSALLATAGFGSATQEDLKRFDWADAHIEAWRDTFRAFGSKPQRTPCSAEALRKRVERDGALPAINAIVDLYNTISVTFAVPIGGEDVRKYQGVPHLIRATGDEIFETVRDGAPHEERVDSGEVIWRDERGVTCRRWNWRQSPRTSLDLASVDMWFVIERLAPMPMEQLEAAGERLTDGIRRLAPAATFETKLRARPSST